MELMETGDGAAGTLETGTLTVGLERGSYQVFAEVLRRRWWPIS
jgi:hypothetical protein